jgi:hypothetical protein
MDRLSVLMVMAGAALGATTVVQQQTDPPTDPFLQSPHVTIASITTIPAATETAGATQAATASHRIRVFSPARPLIAIAESDGDTPVVSRPPPSTWSTVVIPDSSSSTSFSSPRPGDARARSALAADLQRELRRVGCYKGEINGGWTSSTRAAMAIFLERVNASLPIDEPDYILLNLVEGQSVPTCGAPCPSGKALDASGACVPKAVLAQTAHRSHNKLARIDARHRIPPIGAQHFATKDKSEAVASVDARETDSYTAYDQAEPLPGRMSIGGPINDGAVPGRATAAGVAGLAGGKSGPAINSESKSAKPEKWGRSKTSRASDASRPKKHRYASGFGGKGRKYQPRVGTPRYNALLSLGGIY